MRSRLCAQFPGTASLLAAAITVKATARAEFRMSCVQNLASSAEVSWRVGGTAAREIGEEHLLAFDQREALRRRHDLREGLVKIKILLACLQILNRVPQRRRTHVGGRCRGLCAKNDERAKPMLLMRVRNRIPGAARNELNLSGTMWNCVTRAYIAPLEWPGRGKWVKRFLSRVWQ